MATAYASADDLTLRLPEAKSAQLMTEKADEGEAEDRVTASILEAEGIVNQRLAAAGWAVPITGAKTDPDMIVLRSHVLSIAKFLMLDRRGMVAYDPSAQRLYDAAMDWLKAPTLVTAKPAQAAATTFSSVRAGSQEKVYGTRADGTNPMKGL